MMNWICTMNDTLGKSAPGTLAFDTSNRNVDGFRWKGQLNTAGTFYSLFIHVNAPPRLLDGKKYPKHSTRRRTDHVTPLIILMAWCWVSVRDYHLVCLSSWWPAVGSVWGTFSLSRCPLDGLHQTDFVSLTEPNPRISPPLPWLFEVDIFYTPSPINLFLCKIRES